MNVNSEAETGVVPLPLSGRAEENLKTSRTTDPLTENGRMYLPYTNIGYDVE
jgi:hypothetical protein